MTTLLSEWMEFSREERTAHVDLSSPCECEINHKLGQKRGFQKLLKFFNLTNDIARRSKTGQVLHLCGNGSHSGHCSNPLHLYFGTAKENNGIDKTPEAKAAGGYACKGWKDRPKRVVEKKSGVAAMQQVWISLKDGFVSHAAGVSYHNKSIGADMDARVRVQEELIPLLKGVGSMSLMQEDEIFNARINNAINLEIYKNWTES